MTGLPRAEARLSPRTLYVLLTVLVMFISEVVAQVSLPPATLGTQAQGTVRNLIPFRGLNCFVVGFIVVTLGWHLVVISYSSTPQDPSAEAGVMMSRTAGWIPPLIMFFMLLKNSKARAFTRRKMADWWRARWQSLGAPSPCLAQIQDQVQAPALVPAPAPLPAVVESSNVAQDPDPEVLSAGYTGWAESKVILVQEANVCV